MYADRCVEPGRLNDSHRSNQVSQPPRDRVPAHQELAGSQAVAPVCHTNSKNTLPVRDAPRLLSDSVKGCSA